MQCSNRVSACRREQNSHDAAKPQADTHSQPRARQRTVIECGRTDRHSVSSIRQTKKDVIMACAAQNNKDNEPLCHITKLTRAGTTGFKSVRRVAAAGTGASAIGPWLRLECVAHHGLQCGAGSTWSGPRGVTGPRQAKHQHSPGAALPNSSLKRSANGRPPGPSSRYGVHFLLPGPGVLPLSPA